MENCEHGKCSRYPISFQLHLLRKKIFHAIYVVAAEIKLDTAKCRRVESHRIHVGVRMGEK